MQDLDCLKRRLDGLVSRYKTAAFIPTDPISFPHRFRQDPAACELVAFLAALFSYGQRKKILETVESILLPMDADPVRYVARFSPRREGRAYQNFVYRFNRGSDLVFLLERLKRAYGEYGSLEQLFQAVSPREALLRERIGAFIDWFLAEDAADRYGMKFLLAHPGRGGSCKRLHMFLRWMVRQDAPEEEQVDLGVWRNALTPGELLLPLDTHVAKSIRRLGLTERRANDWRTVEEASAVFKRLCPEDPIRYDFALFGLGVEKAWDEAAD